MIYSTNLQKVRMQQQGLCVKLTNLTTSATLLLKLCIGSQEHIAFNTKFQLSASSTSLEQPFIICLISFNLILQQDNDDLHLTDKHPCVNKNFW